MGARVDNCGNIAEKSRQTWTENQQLYWQFIVDLRLLQWSDGGKKADWIGLNQCVRSQDIESKSVEDSVANYMQCYKQR